MKKVLLFILLSICLTSCSIDDYPSSGCGTVTGYDVESSGGYTFYYIYIKKNNTNDNVKIGATRSDWYSAHIGEQYCWE